MKYFRSNRRHFNRKKYILCVLKCVCACSITSVLSDSGTLWTVANQAPVSMGFSRQEYCSGLSDPPPGDLPDPGVKPGSPALQADSLRLSLWGSPYAKIHQGKKKDGEQDKCRK